MRAVRPQLARERLRNVGKRLEPMRSENPCVRDDGTERPLGSKLLVPWT